MVGKEVIVKTPFGVYTGKVVRQERSRKYPVIYVVETRNGKNLFALPSEIKERQA